MIDLISEILATLRHNKLRTALTGLAVSWGIFLLIVLLGASGSLVGGMKNMFAKRDTQSINIEGGWARKPYKGLTDARRIQLKESDQELLMSKNGSDVNRVSAIISCDTATISTGKDYATGGYQGVYPQALRTEGATMESGRFINNNDIRQGRRVIVLARQTAENLFGTRRDPVGQLVKIHDLTFTVVGIYNHEWNRKGMIPYTTARNLSGGSDDVKRITAGVDRLTTQAEGEAAEQRIYETLGKTHHFDASDKSALWVRNQFLQQVKQSTAVNVLNIAVWVIGLLTMVSGIVGVSNIMFVSVRERTHEIGVRRAIGARPAYILRQIILESVAITTLFGYIGIVAGVAVTQLFDMLTGGSEMFGSAAVDLGVALQVTLVLIVAGALAGLFPALKALKIKPVEALRDE